jgi:hypothetical protein
MQHNVHRLLGLTVALTLASTACGDGGSGGGLSTRNYCEPMQDQILALAGADAVADHSDQFVSEEESPTLACIWIDEAEGVRVQVTYYPEPTELLIGASEGKSDLPGLDVPNGDVGGGYSMRAPNGWVIAFSYDIDSQFVDEPDALLAIANAALELVGP